MITPEDRRAPEEPPPLLGTWRRVYVAVVVYLALLIGFFAWFTKAYQR
jgi:hypothetical protein